MKKTDILKLEEIRRTQESKLSDILSADITDKDLLIYSVLANMSRQLSLLNKIFISYIDQDNPDYIDAQTKVVTSAGTPVQLPDLLIPFGHSAVLKAISGNVGNVRLGKSRLDAKDPTIGFPLEVGASVEYKIKNLSILWLDADNSGDGIHWTVEKFREVDDG